MTIDKMEILNDLIMLTFKGGLPSGRRAIDTRQLTEKPPKEFSSHVPIVAPERLKESRKVINDLIKAIDLLTIKPKESNAYLIAKGNWPVALELLKDAQDAFEILKEKFLEEHDDANMKFPSLFEGWEHLVESKLLSADEISDKFKFGWTAFAITPALESIVKAEDAGLEAMVDNFGDSLFHEIAVDARKSFKAPKDSSFKLWIEDPNKIECTAKSLNPLRRISEKLSNLLLLHPSAIHIRDLVDDVISRLSSKGPYVGSDFMMIKGVINIVTKEKSMDGYGQQIQKNTTSSGEYLDIWAAKANDANAPEARAIQETGETLVGEGENERGLVFDMAAASNLWDSSESNDDKAEQAQPPLPIALDGACVDSPDSSPF